MKSFSFLYELTRYVFSPAIRVFYKNIQIRNFSHFPFRGGVFICSNHVNAFMDPVALQLHSTRQIFSLARGDAFNKPFLRWLLTQWKLIPIFRLSEGAEHLKKNEYSFATSQLVLTKGNPLVIYPEAVCVQERRIRKLKKGAARIAFGVEGKAGFKAGLTILPVGLNYSDPKKFRSTLFINFGEPLYIADYEALYKEDKAKAINDLTSAIEKAMKGLVINIGHRENDQLVEDLFAIYKPILMQELNSDPGNLEQDFEAGRAIANAVNHFQLGDPAFLEGLKLKLNLYKNHLSELKLRDHLLSGQGIRTLNRIRVISDWILSLSGFPLYLIALVMNYLPYKLGKSAADKLAKEVEFHASINMTIGWIAWLVYYFLQLLLVGLLFRNWPLLGIYALAVPLGGFYALGFQGFLKKSAGRRRLFRLKARDKGAYDVLMMERTTLLEILGEAKQRYCRLPVLPHP
jgi:glycerol-3-phosphate O-acyltransferase/dihydroxyacetone phosphate acyltransferase